MKKLFLSLGFLFLATVGYSAQLESNTTYYNLQHYKVVKSTADANEPINKFYYRGDFYIVNDTHTVQIADITPYLILYSTGTIWAKRIETDEFITVSSQTLVSSSMTVLNMSITNGLDVDTDTLYVDYSNDRVGINDATPSYGLDVNGTSRFTGNADLEGFTKLGSGNPAIKLVTFSTKTALAQGGVTYVAHGLSSETIISVTTRVDHQGNSTATIAPNNPFSGYGYYFDVNATNINITLTAASSANILDKDVTICVLYID